MLRSMAGKGAAPLPQARAPDANFTETLCGGGPGSRRVIVFTFPRFGARHRPRAPRSDPRERSARTRRAAGGPGKGTGYHHGDVPRRERRRRRRRREASAQGRRVRGGWGVGYLPGVGEADDGTGCRIKVAEFIGQGDTSRGGRAAPGRLPRRGASRRRTSCFGRVSRGRVNTIVATSIGEEGLDIPAVDLIVFFDVVDIIRTIQRMGRTGRARGREGGGAGGRGGRGGGQVQQGSRATTTTCSSVSTRSASFRRATTARECYPRGCTPRCSSRNSVPPGPAPGEARDGTDKFREAPSTPRSRRRRRRFVPRSTVGRAPHRGRDVSPQRLRP